MEVARHSHFTWAAERLRVAQPSLSQQIKGLESELGERLFDRTSRRVRLTPAGEAFLVHAERVLAEVEGAKEEVRGFSGEVRGWVTVGALPSVVEARLPALVASFGVRYPEVTVSLREGSTAEMLRLLTTGEINLALAHAIGGVAPTRMVTEKLYSEALDPDGIFRPSPIRTQVCKAR